MEKYEVSVFNTITKKYEMVEVSKEVFDAYRRTGWGCENDDRRYYSHTTDTCDLECGFKDAFENLNSYVSECIHRYERETSEFECREIVRDAMEVLKPRDRALIEAIYFEEKTLEEYGRELGVTRQTIHQRKDRILRVLKKEILKNFNEKS